MTIQCDRCNHHIEARKSDIIVLENAHNEVLIIDIALPEDKRVREKKMKWKRNITTKTGD